MLDLAAPHVARDHGVKGVGVSEGHSVEHPAGKIRAAAFGVEIEEGGVEEEGDVVGEGEGETLEEVRVEGEAKREGGGGGRGEVGADGEEGEESDVIGLGVGGGEHEREG